MEHRHKYTSGSAPRRPRGSGSGRTRSGASPAGTARHPPRRGSRGLGAGGAAGRAPRASPLRARLPGSHQRGDRGDLGALLLPGLQVLQREQRRVVQAQRVGLDRLVQRLLEGVVLQLQHQPARLLPLGLPLLRRLPPAGGHAQPAPDTAALRGQRPARSRARGTGQGGRRLLPGPGTAGPPTEGLRAAGRACKPTVSQKSRFQISPVFSQHSPDFFFSNYFPVSSNNSRLFRIISRFTNNLSFYQ